MDSPSNYYMYIMSGEEGGEESYFNLMYIVLMNGWM